MERKFYAAYGSNLNVEQMERRCPGAVAVGTASLEDWRLRFRGSKTGAYLTIEPEPGFTVQVGVWEITPADELALDRYEGFPSFYQKKTLRVKMNRPVCACNSEVDALVYIMREDRPLGAPTMGYVQTCLDGCMDFGLDTEPLLEAVRRARKEALK